MKRKHLPAWAPDFLRYDSWAECELLNLLCGYPPYPPPDARPKTREQQVEESGHRFAASRHVNAAIRAGRLRVLPSIATQRLLDQVLPHITDPIDAAAIHQAVTVARMYSENYHVGPRDAIQWAVSSGWFPKFPFTLADLESPVAANGGKVSEDLKEHRRRLVKHVLRPQKLTQTEFCRKQLVSPDVLRAMIAGDRRRCNQQRESELLQALGLSRDAWYFDIDLIAS